MILGNGDLHQVEYRWENGRDVTTFAHSGLSDNDLRLLERCVLPVARAPQAPGAPTTSIVHLAFPSGLDNMSQPLGVVLVRRSDPGAVTDLDPRGGTFRQRLASRALIIPEINNACFVALRLAAAGLSDVQPGMVTEPGHSLPPLLRTTVDLLIRPEHAQHPDFGRDDETRMLLQATISHFLGIGVDLGIDQTRERRRLSIEMTSQWTPDLSPTGEHSHQIALLTALFHALRGGFAELSETHKPWNGSFSTFEQVTDNQDTCLLPQLIFERPAAAGSNGRGRYSRLSPQHTHENLANDAGVQEVVELLARCAVSAPKSLWRPDSPVRQHPVHAQLISHLRGSTTVPGTVAPKHPAPAADQPAGGTPDTPDTPPVPSPAPETCGQGALDTPAEVVALKELQTLATRFEDLHTLATRFENLSALADRLEDLLADADPPRTPVQTPIRTPVQTPIRTPIQQRTAPLRQNVALTLAVIVIVVQVFAEVYWGILQR